jgi:hypothetical protein
MSTKKKKPAQAVETQGSTGSVEAISLPTIVIRNSLNQLIPFNIKRADGKLIGIQLDANAFIVWPKLPDYGPDFDRLMKRKVLRFEMGK